MSGGGANALYNPQLATFLRVADAGSFNRAAEELFISPSAVIKQINLLEGSLGARLFARSHRGLTLTPAGASLYKDAKTIISYSADAVARMKSADDQNSSVIRVGTSPMTPSDFLMQLQPRIHPLCPDIRFELVPYENTPENAREILKNLGERIDIVAGLFDQAFLDSRHCAALELSREPIRCAVSVSHPLSSLQRLTMQDLHGERFMLIRRGWNSYLDILRDDLWSEHPQVEIVDFDFFNTGVFNQCERGGCVMMTIDAWKNVHPMLRVIPVDWPYTAPFGVMHAPKPSPVVSRFLKAVQTVIDSKDK